jgi:hypothetical protein
MILTTSVEWSDWSSSSDHLSRSIKKRDPGRQEGAARRKRQCRSRPRFLTLSRC